MSGGRAGFIDESTGDLVKHLRASAPISDLVGVDIDARIFAESAPLGAEPPHIVYTQASGHSSKDLSGLEQCDDITLHIYAWAASQSVSRLLARAILLRTTGADNTRWGDTTHVHVCNGGIVDTGYESAHDHSDRKLYWSRLVLRLVISDTASVNP